MLKISLLGYGTIGKHLANIVDRDSHSAEIVCVMVRNPDNRCSRSQVTSIDTLLDNRPDVVIECAGQYALSLYGEVILREGIPLVAASVGAFADIDFYNKMQQTARANNSQIIIPSGGLAGTDTLRAAKAVGIDQVTYRGSAPPIFWSLNGNINKRVIYSGSAREVCCLFPKNANVAAAVSIAGIGFDKTIVELVADPSLNSYRHEIIASGQFGTLTTKTNANPIETGKRSTLLITGSLISAALSTQTH